MTHHNQLKKRDPITLLLLHATWAGLVLATITLTATAEPDQPNFLSNAATVITRLHTALVNASNTLETGALEQRYTYLEPVISDTHDLPYIGRFAMRRYWSDLTEEQQTEFIAAFSRLSIATYANRFADVTDETFTISGKRETARGHIEIIGTLTQDNGEALDIIYVLHRLPDDRNGDWASDWRIINILVDGVSDLALKRAEYQPVYTTKGFPGIIDLLSAQTTQFMQIPTAGSD